jgi:hypothetical protein
MMIRLRTAIRRLRRARKELAGADAWWFHVDELLDWAGLETSGARNYSLRDGSEVSLRPASDDSQEFKRVFLEADYAPFATSVHNSFSKPSVLVELDGQSGLAALYLERCLRFDHIIAIEPDFDNLQALRANLDHNLGAPCESIQAYAGGRFADDDDVTIPVLRMEEIVPRVPGGVLLKCSLDQAECHLLPRVQEWEERVTFLLVSPGDAPNADMRLQTALARSSYEWRTIGSLTTDVLALERAVRKPETVHSVSDTRSHSSRAAAL